MLNSDLGKANIIILSILIPSSFPSFTQWPQGHRVQNNPLVTWGRLPWLPLLLTVCSPSLLPGGVVPEAGKALMLWKHCSTIKKHLYIINSIFSINPKHSPILFTVKKIYCTRAKTSTAWYTNCYPLFSAHGWRIASGPNNMPESQQKGRCGFFSSFRNL